MRSFRLRFAGSFCHFGNHEESLHRLQGTLIEATEFETISWYGQPPYVSPNCSKEKMVVPLCVFPLGIKGKAWIPLQVRDDIWRLPSCFRCCEEGRLLRCARNNMGETPTPPFLFPPGYRGEGCRYPPFIPPYNPPVGGQVEGGKLVLSSGDA